MRSRGPQMLTCVSPNLPSLESSEVSTLGKATRRGGKSMGAERQELASSKPFRPQSPLRELRALSTYS